MRVISHGESDESLVTATNLLATDTGFFTGVEGMIASGCQKTKWL